MAKNMVIRTATQEDAAQLLEIYAPYVTDTAITFEYDVPDEREFAGRIAKTLEKYPYLVAFVDGRAEGYAYASAFHSRAAYGWCVETSIYVRMDARGSGVGGALYRKLEEALIRQGMLNLNACIAWTEQEDKHLTNASVSFHEHFGYRMVGRFNQCGYKFGKWYDMVWMEKLVGAHEASVENTRTFDEVRDEMGL